MSRLLRYRWQAYEKNFIEFNYGLDNKDHLAVKRLSRFSRWYYHPGFGLFAPQRFLGYFGTTQDNYDGWSSGNESKTLPTYFEFAGTEVWDTLYEKLSLFAKKNGFKLNFSTCIYVPKQEVLEKFILDEIHDFDSDTTMLESELANEETAYEGNGERILISRFERDPRLRKLAIVYHGLVCMVCGFNFENFYGIEGRGYIDVHHLTPLSKIRNTHLVNPIKDMVVVCANCHRMLHRHSNTIISIDDLRKLIKV